MQNTFFTRNQFNKDFGKELASAFDVYSSRKNSGLNDWSIAAYDFIFISDTKEKLENLADFLTKNYSYTTNKVTRTDNLWELTGDAIPFAVTEETLRYWALDLYKKGLEYDCRLDGYGAMGDPQNQIFPERNASKFDSYFEAAMQTYNLRNLGQAFINFSLAIESNPHDPDAWYSRAIVRDKLETWKAARRDYDKAIEIAPNFVSAIVNRAANKDYAGEYDSAIADYDTAIAFDPQNAMAYFNRGNSKLNKGDTTGACSDWQKANELGDQTARSRIDEYCKSPSSFTQKLKGFFGG